MAADAVKMRPFRGLHNSRQN